SNEAGVLLCARQKCESGKRTRTKQKAQTTQNRKDKHKPGCRRVCALQIRKQDKCGVQHSHLPLHGRTSGSPKCINAD
ncbi:hypothetical protein, partial [Undibacterium squillarum]|uniref:hypothetical protein n=1 Tax=Undibacterium squillarum TaxID=1131567 RepID=UPI001E3ECB08